MAEYTPAQTLAFQEYCDRERHVTLSMHGLTEETITTEQEDALTRYLRIAQAVYLAQYGPAGPRGSSLRVETQAETTARFAFEETLKTDEQRLLERVEAVAVAYCVSSCGIEASAIRVCLVEEASDIETARSRESGELDQGDRLFEVHIDEGTKHNHIELTLWLATHPGNEIEVLQAWSKTVEINGNWYLLRDLAKMTEEDREDLQAWKR